MIQNVTGVPSQALQVIFQMQSQRNSQKRAIKKIRFFKLQTHFFQFSSFWPLLLHQCITFSLFFVQIERFELLWNCHLKLYKSSSNSKSNEVIFKEFLRGSEIGYELLGLVFLINQTPLTSGGCNFLASSSFLPLFSVIDAPRGGLHLILGHYKQWALLQKWWANLTLSDHSWAVLP